MPLWVYLLVILVATVVAVFRSRQQEGALDARRKELEAQKRDRDLNNGSGV